MFVLPLQGTSIKRVFVSTAGGPDGFAHLFTTIEERNGRQLL